MRRVTWFPVDVAIGDEGMIYVLDRGQGAGGDIRKINWDDEDLGTIGGSGDGDGKFVWPVAIARDKAGNLYVSDEALDRITIFDRDGNFVDKWGASGDGPGQFNRASGIALDPDENLYVADALNHRIQKFTKDGRFLSAFGSFGSGDGQLNMPWGLATDELGDVYVADWRNDRVQKFSGGGQFVMEIGAACAGDGAFNRPTGVCVDSDGDIYVADRGNNRVQQFDPHGRYVYKFLGDATLGKMARRYIITSAKVLRLREMAKLEGAKVLRSPTSVKVDAEGRLYITDFSSHRLQVYKKEAYPLTPDEVGPELDSPDLYTV